MSQELVGACQSQGLRCGFVVRSCTVIWDVGEEHQLMKLAAPESTEHANAKDFC